MHRARSGTAATRSTRSMFAFTDRRRLAAWTSGWWSTTSRGSHRPRRRDCCEAGLVDETDHEAAIRSRARAAARLASRRASGTSTSRRRGRALRRRSAGSIELVGEAGKRLHTGRSRNDQVVRRPAPVAARRGPPRRGADGRAGPAPRLRAARALPRVNAGVPMPGYTHLRRAMPSTVGDWDLAPTPRALRGWTAEDLGQRHARASAPVPAGQRRGLRRARCELEPGLRGAKELGFDAARGAGHS